MSLDKDQLNSIPILKKSEFLIEIQQLPNLIIQILFPTQILNIQFQTLPQQTPSNICMKQTIPDKIIVLTVQGEHELLTIVKNQGREVGVEPLIPCDHFK